MSTLGNMAFASMGKPTGGGAVIDPDYVLTTADPAGNWIPAADADVRQGVSNGIDSKGTLPVPVINPNSANIALVQRAQVGMLRDKGRIGVVVQNSDTDPTDISWSYGAEMLIGFHTTPPTETADGADVTITDGEIRIMPGVAVNPGDRVQVTMIDLVTLEQPQYFAVVGAPTVGIAATRCRVKRITGEGAL